MNNCLKLDETIDNLTNAIKSYGYDFKNFEHLSIHASDIKSSTGTGQLELIQKSYEKYWDLIKAGQLENETELDLNIRHLHNFLNDFGLKLGSKFSSTIKSGHIIELYAKNHQQLFRSTNFFRLSSYDIEVLTFLPWNKLFNRKQTDQNELLKWANLVVDNNINLCRPTGIKHILTEIATGRRFSYKLDHIGSLTDELTGLPIGYATTILVKELAGNIRQIN